MRICYAHMLLVSRSLLTNMYSGLFRCCAPQKSADTGVIQKN